ncbi:MAG: AIPR family protein [Candidatus Hodarchaeota archaeon]
MNLRQQIIQDHIDKTINLLSVDKDIAFLRFSHSLITGISVHSFDLDDFVDGGQDKQIDIITIDEAGDRADVYILQVKNTDSFSSNALIQMRNGLNWIFNKTRKDVLALKNVEFKDKILEYRALQSNLGPSNIRILVGFITNGISSNISDEFIQERQTIIDEYDNDTFEEFEFVTYGADELVTLLKTQQRQTRRIDAEIRMKYDANNPSLIKYYAQDLKGLVCSVPAQEIARLVNADTVGAIFDLNLRRFLGIRGTINKDILATCKSAQSSYEFWFLNNGITVVCDEMDPVTDPDNPIIKLKNMQIVNGCQTATALALAQKDNKLASDVRVLLRIYETDDPDLIGKIVLTTNNQNKIGGRDLRANDDAQLDMETGFKIYNYFYERKSRQFDEEDIDTSRIIPNDLVAQSYLSIVLKNPADGRARKYKLWGDLYSKIFSGDRVEPYIIASLLSRSVVKWLRSSGLNRSEDELIRSTAKRGSFHLARIVSFLWRNGDYWKNEKEYLANEIAEIEKGTEVIEPLCKDAFDILKNLISA